MSCVKTPMDVGSVPAPFERRSRRHSPEHAIGRLEMPASTAQQVTGQLRFGARDQNVHVTTDIGRGSPIQPLLKSWALQVQDRHILRAEFLYEGARGGLARKREGHRDN